MIKYLCAPKTNFQGKYKENCNLWTFNTTVTLLSKQKPMLSSSLSLQRAKKRAFLYRNRIFFLLCVVSLSATLSSFLNTVSALQKYFTEKHFTYILIYSNIYWCKKRNSRFSTGGRSLSLLQCSPKSN